MYVRKLSNAKHYMRAAQLLVLQDFSNEEHVWQDIDFDASLVVLQSSKPKLLACMLIDRQSYLAYLVVRESKRGKGIGSLLMQHCSATSLTCESSIVPFYERYGFSVSCTEKDGRLRLSKTNAEGRRCQFEHMDVGTSNVEPVEHDCVCE